MVVDGSDAGREAQIVGDVAEAAFTNLVVEAGLNAVKAAPDRTGWDFCVEEVGTPAGPALDLAPAAWRWMVQVKGVTRTDRPIRISLENWRRMATDPQPWFVFVAVVQDRRTVDAYLVHIDEGLIGQTLSRLRRASVERPGRLHKMEMTLPWGDECRLESLTGRELKRRMYLVSEGSPVNYQLRKSKVNASIGYTGPRRVMRFDVEPKHLNQLADFVIGRQGAVPVHALEVQDTRFGVNLNVASYGPGILKGPPAPSVGQATVTVVDGLRGIVASAAFEVRHARSVVPELPADLDRAVLVRPHLELFTGATVSKVNVRFGVDDVEQPRKLSTFGTSAEVVAALLAQEGDDVAVEVTAGESPPMRLTLGPGWTVEPVVRAYVQAFADGTWVARRAGIGMDSLEVPEAFALQNTKLAFLRAALAGRAIDWSGSVERDLVLEPGLTGTLATTIVEFADMVFATAVSCVGKGEILEGANDSLVSVKGARPSLEREVTMSKSEFERRRTVLFSEWSEQAEAWLTARGVVNAFRLPG